MKNLLNYQSTEYDCGPVSLVNGIRYLFEREDIFPDVIKFISLYCMDTYNDAGEICKRGTSPAAMDYICNWLNHFSEVKDFPIHCEHITGEEVVITENSKIMNALKNGGVVVLRLFLEVSHYVLLTGIDGERILLFDPYYEEEDDPDFDEEYKTDEIRFLYDCPKKANRSVSISRINSTGTGYYEMGDFPCREALIMFHKSSISE